MRVPADALQPCSKRTAWEVPAAAQASHLDLHVPAAAHIQAALVGFRRSGDLASHCKLAEDGRLPGRGNGFLGAREHDGDGANVSVHMQHLHLHRQPAGRLQGACVLSSYESSARTLLGLRHD